MDNQSDTSGQIPQFDPSATPPPPGDAPILDQNQAPGAVVEPSANPAASAFEPPMDDLTPPAAPDLPPPPFEQTSGIGPAIQPTIPQQDAAPVAPGDMNAQAPVEEFALPTQEPISDITPTTQPLDPVVVPDTPVDEPVVAPSEPLTVEDVAPVAQAAPAFDPSTAMAAAPVDEPAVAPAVTEQVDTALEALGPPAEQLPIEDNPVIDPLPIEEPVAAQLDQSAADVAAPVEEPLSVEEPVTEDESAQTEVIDPAAARVAEGELELIKQQALRELAPIANQLDQEPVDRFHTLLELIQATDNHDLVQPAFESAQAIDEEKERAAALLNLVNEVSYLEKLENGEADEEHHDESNDHDE